MATVANGGTNGKVAMSDIPLHLLHRINPTSLHLHASSQHLAGTIYSL